MSRLVVAISREFGSGGRLLGERLAQELGLRFYDRALLTLAARDSGFAPEAFEEAEAEAANKFLFNLSMGGGAIRDGLFWVAPPVGDQIFIAQSKTIERLAEEGGCVLVGRCAAHLLRRDPHCLKVFVHGEKEDRLHRIISQLMQSGLRASRKRIRNCFEVTVRKRTIRAERSEERRVGKECRSRWSPYH